MDTKNSNKVRYECSFCGRVWTASTKTPGATTGWTGFLSSAVDKHLSYCEKRTPQERFKVNLRDQHKWQSKPPKHTTITLNWHHPGIDK